MLKGQVKVVAQIHGKENGFSFSRQLPSFIVCAFCFSTATSIVKTMFQDQNVAGQLVDSEGNIENLSIRGQ